MKTWTYPFFIPNFSHLNLNLSLYTITFISDFPVSVILQVTSYEILMSSLTSSFFCPHKQLSNPADCSLGVSLEYVPSLPSSAWLPEDCLDCYSIWFPTGFCSQRHSTWFPTGFCSQHLPDPAYSTHSDLAGGPKTPLWLYHYIFSRWLIAPFCLQG